jgi:Domain of unknown function (DUF305)
MVPFIRSRLGRGSVTVAAAVVAVTAALAANAAGTPSLAEYIAAICSAAFRSAPPHEVSFLSENTGAMTKMLVGMEIRPSGDIDQDFVAMMVPHHQAAIDMAVAVLRYGRNAQIRRLAQEIIVTQQQEIAAMRLAVGEPLPPSIPSPAQPSAMRPTDAPIAR